MSRKAEDSEKQNTESRSQESEYKAENHFLLIFFSSVS
jgi:hypothetical protein